MRKEPNVLQHPKVKNPVETLANTRHEFGEHGGVNMSIEASTTFTAMHPDILADMFCGEKGPDKGGCYLYGRHFNPTVYSLSKQLAALEGTEAAYCTASGMAAISATLIQLCNAGDHIVSSNTIYGGSYALMHDLLPLKNGITTTLVDINDLAAVEAAITEKTRVILRGKHRQPDAACREHPGTQRDRAPPRPEAGDRQYLQPADPEPETTGCGHRGAQHDQVHRRRLRPHLPVRSAPTRSSSCELMDLHTGALMLLGPTMDPQVAFNLSLRIPHLPLRMAEHGRRAALFAERLQELGLDVTYPGLPDHPDHELLGDLHCPDYGYGGILTLDMGPKKRPTR